MSRNGSGTYSLPAGNPVVTGTTISSTWANNTLSDLATAMTASIAKDGQTTLAGNLNFASTYKLINLAAGSATGDSLRWQQLFDQGLEIDLASAATTDIGIQNTNFLQITGSTGITSFGTNYKGPRFLRFSGALTLTHNATSLILPTGANITTAAGDCCIAIPKATAGVADGWKVLAYQRADGTSLAGVPANSISTAMILDGAVTQPKLDATVRKLLNVVQDFRLTLTTSVPVTTADVTGATTIYCTPYTGNSIALYDGTNWNVRTSAEFSLALGTLTSAKPYDVFCYDNAGVPTLEFLAWTNDTTRATALVRQDGVLVKTGALTRRYLGTFYTTSTTTTEDSFKSRLLYNYYNRVRRGLKANDTTASWTYTTATWRAANNNSTVGQGRVQLFQGVAEDAVTASYSICSNNSTGNQHGPGIGIDSTSANSSTVSSFTSAANNTPQRAEYSAVLAEGFHYVQALEYSVASGTTTWVGVSIAIFQAHALLAEIRA